MPVSIRDQLVQLAQLAHLQLLQEELDRVA